MIWSTERCLLTLPSAFLPPHLFYIMSLKGDWRVSVLNLHHSAWATLELFLRGTNWWLGWYGLSHHLGSVVISSEELGLWSILQEELLWHPGPHLEGVPVLRESQAGHDFSSESAEIPLFLPSALCDWEVYGKQECTSVKSSVVAASFSASIKSSGFV